jgi:phosphohistidine swiveling domain-containing protein
LELNIVESAVITSASPAAAANGKAGAKGKNLYELTSHGIAVPAWAIVGTDVFDAFLADSDVGEKLTALLAGTTVANAEDVAEQIRALFAGAELNAAARAAATEAYRHVGGGRVAVRSSGADEDGAEHSFAGQFDTYLNVREAEEVLLRIRECWASTYSARSLHYRLRNNLPLKPAAMAVIVQKMVPAERSGVLFTANPATGDPDQYVVSSAYGLGEGLVSGAVDADTIVLDAATGTVLDTVVGEKQQRFQAAGGSGCDVVEVPAAERERLSVTDADVTRLREAGALAVKIFGCPQDIEWAVADDRLWILQSRPITTPLRSTARPNADGELRIWDNSNIIESFSGIVSPLTFTFAADTYGKVYEYYARALRVPTEQLRQMGDWLPRMLGHFNGRVYYNLKHWYRMVRLAPLYRLNRRVLEVSLGVEESLTDEAADAIHPYTFSSTFRRRYVRLVSTAAFAYHFLTLNRAVKRFLAYFYDSYKVFDGLDYDSLPGDEVHRRFQALQRDLIERWGPMQMIDSTLLLSFGALHLLTKRFMPDAPEWFGWAVASPGPDVESAEPTRALRALAATLRREPELLKMVEEGLAGEALTGHPEFVAYVDSYGYRSPDELKLEEPDLREDPSRLVLMLRDALNEPPPTENSDQAQIYLDAHLRGPRRWVYEVVRRKVRSALINRERLRFCRTRAFGSAKRMLRALGRDLVRVGAIAEFQDVFYLQLSELTGAYEGTVDPADFRELVQLRKRDRQRYERLSAPSRFVTRGAPYFDGNLEAAGWTAAATARTGRRELKGTPSGPGIAEGRAVVATEPTEVNGGILIAYRTDPGWVAALPSASGLIIERGSPLTHVAIVARELNIPTIVKLKGATTDIQTGMWIRMDGGTGAVTIVDKENLA